MIASRRRWPASSASSSRRRSSGGPAATAGAAADGSRLARRLQAARRHKGGKLTDDSRPTRGGPQATVQPERALLAGLDLPGAPWDLDTSLDELEALAESAGLTVIGRVTQRAESPHPRHYVGKGKLAELQEYTKNDLCDVVVFDDELAPRVQQNLEQELGVKV